MPNLFIWAHNPAYRQWESGSWTSGQYLSYWQHLLVSDVALYLAYSAHGLRFRPPIFPFSNLIQVTNVAIFSKTLSWCLGEIMVHSNAKAEPSQQEMMAAISHMLAQADFDEVSSLLALLCPYLISTFAVCVIDINLMNI